MNATEQLAWLEKLAQNSASCGDYAKRQLEAIRHGNHMAAKVRALSYRVPLTVRCGDRGFTYSISGWYGVV